MQKFAVNCMEIIIEVSGTLEKQRSVIDSEKINNDSVRSKKILIITVQNQELIHEREIKMIRK